MFAVAIGVGAGEAWIEVDEASTGFGGLTGAWVDSGFCAVGTVDAWNGSALPAAA
jgi:hypothetical protein